MIESKSQSLVFIPSNSTLDVPVSEFKNMNYFDYDSSHSNPFECFGNYNENEDITSKELSKAMEGNEK